MFFSQFAPCNEPTEPIVYGDCYGELKSRGNNLQAPGRSWNTLLRRKDYEINGLLWKTGPSRWVVQCNELEEDIPKKLDSWRCAGGSGGRIASARFGGGWVAATGASAGRRSASEWGIWARGVDA